MKFPFHSIWLLPVLSGVFIGTSSIPFPPWASLFCFIPLWLFWIQQTDLKSVLFGGFVTSFVFTLIGLNWFVYLLHEFVGLSWTLSLFGMFFFAVMAHLYVPIAGALWFLGQRKFKWSHNISLCILALLTILCEAHSLTLFDWNFGYSWYAAQLPIYHLAEYIGFKGLSALTLLLNLPILMAWQKRRQTHGKIIALSVLILFLILNITGLWIKARLPLANATLGTLMIQSNIHKDKKLSAELRKKLNPEVLQNYLSQTDAAIHQFKNSKINFILWPETAYPDFLGAQFKRDPKMLMLSDFLKVRQLPLITGGFGVSKDFHSLTNSVFAFDKDGTIIEPHYNKTKLLAYGEYIPGEKLFPKMRELLPMAGNVLSETETQPLFLWNGFKMGIQICYESLFPKFALASGDLGAQFIINVTNDSWFGEWQEPYQHLYMALARSVELRRPVLRVANTGISSVALASGEILERSPINQKWNGFYKIPYLTDPMPTFYQRFVWLIPTLLWSTLVLLLLKKK